MRETIWHYWRGKFCNSWIITRINFKHGYFYEFSKIMNNKGESFRKRIRENFGLTNFWYFIFNYFNFNWSIVHIVLTTIIYHLILWTNYPNVGLYEKFTGYRYAGGFDPPGPFSKVKFGPLENIVYFIALSSEFVKLLLKWRS